MKKAFSLPLLALLFACEMSVAGKYVEVDKTSQTLRAFDDGRLVLITRVSTGKRDSWTPNGTFRVGEKYAIHYSTLYHHAAMPYSVQVRGNIFIHGFSYVPQWPDSHGCIRVPLDGTNPAKQFFDWVEPGTPVRITGHWTKAQDHNPISYPPAIRKASQRHLYDRVRFRRS